MAVAVVVGVLMGMLVAVRGVLVVKMLHTDSSCLIDINLTKYTIAQNCQVCKGYTGILSRFFRDVSRQGGLS